MIFLREEVANSNYLRCRSGTHKNLLIEEAYGFKVGMGRLEADSVGEIFSSLADQGFLNSVSEVYSGLWDVVRYSGRTGEEPAVVRAAMEIFPREDDRAGGSPTFLIHYNPRSMANTNDFFVTKGTVILSLVGGQHMYFLGREADKRRDPSDIVAHQSRRRPHSFVGIVRRKQEQGQILATRAVFLASEATSISGTHCKNRDLPAKRNSYANTETSGPISTRSSLWQLISRSGTAKGACCSELDSEGSSHPWPRNTAEPHSFMSRTHLALRTRPACFVTRCWTEGPWRSETCRSPANAPAQNKGKRQWVLRAPLSADGKQRSRSERP